MNLNKRFIGNKRMNEHTLKIAKAE